MSTGLLDLGPAAADMAGALGQLDQLRQQMAALETALLGGLARPAPPVFFRAWVDRLAAVVATEYGVTAADVMGAGRARRFTQPRFVWVWLVKSISRGSYPQVARLCFYQEHTSALHACRRVEALRAADPQFRRRLAQLHVLGQALRQPPAGAEAAA